MKHCFWGVYAVQKEDLKTLEMPARVMTALPITPPPHTHTKGLERAKVSRKGITPLSELDVHLLLWPVGVPGPWMKPG